MPEIRPNACVACLSESEPWHLINVKGLPEPQRVCIHPSQCIERAKKKGIWKRYDADRVIAIGRAPVVQYPRHSPSELCDCPKPLGREDRPYHCAM